MTVSCSLRFSAGSSVKITKHDTNAKNRHARQNGKVKRLIGQLRVDNLQIYLPNISTRQNWSSSEARKALRAPYED